MSFNVGGVPVSGAVVALIQMNKEIYQSALQSRINEAKSNPAGSLKAMMQPSGLASFLDVKI